MVNLDSQKLFTPEVIHSVDKLISIDSGLIEQLIKMAKKNKRKRIRFCSHGSPDEQVHEMFIVHPKGAYIRPHLHNRKIESMLVLKGHVDYVIFENDGSVRKVIQMGEMSSGKTFYNSLREATYHTLLIRSEWLVFLEITKGPFEKKDTFFSEWGPEESDRLGVKKFMKKLEIETNFESLHT